MMNLTLEQLENTAFELGYRLVPIKRIKRIAVDQSAAYDINVPIHYVNATMLARVASEIAQRLETYEKVLITERPLDKDNLIRTWHCAFDIIVPMGPLKDDH